MNLIIRSVPKKTRGYGKLKMHSESGEQTNSFHDLSLVTPVVIALVKQVLFLT